ncbi:protein associated with UVRAG as autophagy enhancer isoform X1 [Rhinolophus ferrumequinum]|uniref:protein associated with UVRAG as autophagy enhancer isoform X1 n=1 Tax=Rhinolophus ferrumequinum TaxID=59479 RepID=UPI00140F725E|nr:protein associated with UVRAG as autophagy enhancer isoform X1 [Rhinolophus ferrumequinum]XP_032960914.1 protein associated with UVRAG as autophagy enhancer isoform X1 [Rhinolophus ferrumequinum]XP_032960915.1 protein associated with UVRAG as autophagy enhancer isoform X1 [Rhinolophus ferrumequinum]XP_032960917.1 protein associated with UVRAG as autophagy enhancer isoform X1 [Rhinolophus ferrumequinum]XP_032960918.1 protein associated with UVRAG as autophagy enhancer isoform X1 [Rhinolophus 
MVSQSSGRQDSPVDPWERVSNYGGSIDGLPSLLDSDHPPCQSDIRATRHKAAWINPPCVQQQLQDLPLRVPTMGNSGSHFVGHAASPLGPSPSSLEDSMMGTISSKPTVGSMGSSGNKSCDVPFTSTQERAVLPGRCPRMSPFPSARMCTAAPRSKANSACFTPSHLTASTDKGAVKVSGRSSSLSSFSPEAFVLPVDVEKENAHFYAADLMISAIEKMKCNILSQQYMENWNTEEASGSLGNDQADSEVTFYTNITQESGSSTSSDSGYEGKWGCAVLQVSPVVQTPIYCDVVKECKCDLDEFVVVELGEFNNITETCGCPCSSSKSVTYEPNFNSAELIAKELYRVFRKCWMLSQVNYQLAGSLSAAGSIVVNEECLRQDFESSVDIVKEIKFKSRLRGTKDWTPPRFQVIVDVHPPLKRDLVVAAQNFFCAGCGTQIEPKFARRLRYCEYLGKYFCDCCHSHSESCIPARILTMWDFRKYYVSNFSKRLLDSIWHQPIFNLRNVNYSLYAKAKELGRVREIQEQLFQIKKMLKTCRFAESTLKEFEQMPRHLTDELHLFSLEDLVRVKKGLLVSSLKDVLKASLEHVACCELCQGKGFICEFCRSTTVIFPFQTATCRRCSACRACFHKQCFQSAECPRCARITARRRLASLLSAAT